MLITGDTTNYRVGVCDDFVTGSCFFHDEVTFLQGGFVGNRSDRGAFTPWTPGTPITIGWRVAADGSVITFADGRPFAIGASGALAPRGMMTPMGAFVSYSLNEGTGTATGSGDTLNIDNLRNDVIAVSDPPGTADLFHRASLGPLANTMAGFRFPSWVVTQGEPFPWYLFALNASVSQAASTQLMASMPASFAVTPGICAGSAPSGSYVSAAQSIATGAIATCDLMVTASQVGDFAVASTVNPTTPDPFSGNNEWTGTVGVRTALPGQRCRTSGGSGCPSIIGAVAGSTTTSSMTVGNCPVVTDIYVGLAFNHSWAGDMRLSLTPPGGTPVVIVDEVCAAGAFAHLQVILADEVPNELGATCPIDQRGAARPQSVLASNFASFLGVPGNGVWTLDVLDSYNGDGGVLDDWSLFLICAEDLFADGFE